METVKIGNVELYENEVKAVYDAEKYICTNTGIFQVHYSPAQNQFYGSKVVDYKGYARRGRFYIHDAEQINKVIGKNVLNVKE